MSNASISDRPWHHLTGEAVCRSLEVDPRKGLDCSAVEPRRAAHGHNHIQDQAGHSPWRMLLGQFSDFMILVLIAAAGVSGVIGEPQDAIAILVIVILNAIIGFIQEYRAERAMAALKKMASPTARVRRNGKVENIPASELVPGDVVLLEAGNVVPADLRLLEVTELRIDEAALTGESEPLSKRTDDLPEEDLPLGDRSNMAFKGTLVTYGRGAGVVVATGMATELGRIASLLSEEQAVKTPLQKRLAKSVSGLPSPYWLSARSSSPRVCCAVNR